MWKKISWNLLVWVLAALAAWAAQKGVTYLSSRMGGSDNEGTEADARARGVVAVAGWAAIAAVSVAVARWLAEKGAATAWRSVMGEEPPGV